MCCNYCSLSQSELPTVQRKLAQLVSGLISLKTIFLHKTVGLSPEIAG